MTRYLPACMALVLLAATGCDRTDSRPAEPAPASAASSTSPAGPATSMPIAVEDRPASPPPKTPDPPQPPPPRPALPASAGSLGLLPTIIGSPDGPQITFPSAVHDFGEVSDRTKVTAHLPFTNTGRQMLVVTDVRSTCGCTAASLGKRRFAPGEGASIDLTFDPAGRADRIEKVVKVMTNARDEPIDVAIRATVRPLVRLGTHLLQLGELPRGQANTTTFELFHTDPELRIELRPEHPNVTAEIVESGPAGTDLVGLPEYRSVVAVTVAPETPWGLLDPGTLHVTAFGRPWPGSEAYEQSYRVFISAQLYGQLHPDPIAFVARGVTRFGDEMEMPVVLTRSEHRPFTVTGATIASCNLPNVKLDWAREASNAWRITAKATATIAGAIKGEVVILTDVPGEERITMTLSAYVK